MKSLLILLVVSALCCTSLVVLASDDAPANTGRNWKGAPEPLTSDQFPEVGAHITTAFAKLGADKENTNFELIRVLEGTRQVVAGFSYKVKAEVEKNKAEKKICDFDIWDRSWDSLRVKITCPDEYHEVLKQKQ